MSTALTALALALAARGYVRLIPNTHNTDTYQPLEEHTND